LSAATKSLSGKNDKDDGDEEEEGEFLTVREKTQKEKDKESQELKSLDQFTTQFWKDTNNLDPNEKFLRDFFRE